MKTIYEFDEGEMVVEVGEDYFKVLAQPEELYYIKHPESGLGIYNSYTIRSVGNPEFVLSDKSIYIRGNIKYKNNIKAPFPPEKREDIIKALREFGAEVVEPEKDVHMYLNVYKHKGFSGYGISFYCTRELADEYTFDRVGRLKIKIEERFDD